MLLCQVLPWIIFDGRNLRKVYSVRILQLTSCVFVDTEQHPVILLFPHQRTSYQLHFLIWVVLVLTFNHVISLPQSVIQLRLISITLFRMFL